MTTLGIIKNLCQRAGQQLTDDTGSHDATASGASGGGGAGRNQPAMKRVAAMTALAMLVSVVASAAPHEVTAAPRKAAAASDDLYSRNFVAIAADNNFRAHYNQWRRQFPRFNWTNDGCSGPARLTGYADNFFWPCVQHDFGYRNNRLVHRHNDATRKFIDGQLLEHTRQLCSHYAVLAKPGCYFASANFYTAVRTFGGSAF